MSNDVRQTRAYRRARAVMFAHRGTTCWHCGHPGAREADHVIPVAQAPHLALDPDNMRPAHGTTCRCAHGCLDAKGRPRACNQSRGANAPAEAQPLRTSRDW